MQIEPGTEVHFTIAVGTNMQWRFIRRPISTLPEEGTIGFLDGYDEKGKARRGVGVFRGGQWWGGKGHSKLKFDPVVWTVLGDMGAKRDGG